LEVSSSSVFSRSDMGELHLVCLLCKDQALGYSIAALAASLPCM
jgi:hypothetical protein